MSTYNNANELKKNLLVNGDKVYINDQVLLFNGRYFTFEGDPDLIKTETRKAAHTIARTLYPDNNVHGTWPVVPIPTHGEELISQTRIMIGLLKRFGPITSLSPERETSKPTPERITMLEPTPQTPSESTFNIHAALRDIGIISVNGAQ